MTDKKPRHGLGNGDVRGYRSPNLEVKAAAFYSLSRMGCLLRGRESMRGGEICEGKRAEPTTVSPGFIGSEVERRPGDRQRPKPNAMMTVF